MTAVDEQRKQKFTIATTESRVPVVVRCTGRNVLKPATPQANDGLPLVRETAVVTCAGDQAASCSAVRWNRWLTTLSGRPANRS